MQIVDGHIVYDIDEVPLPLLFKDLSYQIISSKDNKKLLPVLRIALSKEVRFLLGSNLIDELDGNDITYYIDNGLQLLIDAVCLKFIKHVKENAKDGDPRKADASSYWLEVFSHPDDEKDSYYNPEENDNIGESYEAMLLAKSFLWEVVRPSTKYLLNKYCDKKYAVTISEITDKYYGELTTSDGLHVLPKEELIELMKDQSYEEEHKVSTNVIFLGYVKREKQNDTCENNEADVETASEEQEAKS
jgi:hypothetical protein